MTGSPCWACPTSAAPRSPGSTTRPARSWSTSRCGSWAGWTGGPGARPCRPGPTCAAARSSWTRRTTRWRSTTTRTRPSCATCATGSATPPAGPGSARQPPPYPRPDWARPCALRVCKCPAPGACKDALQAHCGYEGLLAGTFRRARRSDQLVGADAELAGGGVADPVEQQLARDHPRVDGHLQGEAVDEGHHPPGRRGRVLAVEVAVLHAERDHLGERFLPPRIQPSGHL